MLYGRFATSLAERAGRISAQKSVVNASAITSLKFGKPEKRSLSNGMSLLSNSTAMTRPARSTNVEVSAPVPGPISMMVSSALGASASIMR